MAKKKSDKDPNKPTKRKDKSKPFGGYKVGNRINNSGPQYKVNNLHKGMVIAFTIAGYTHEAIAKKIGIHAQTLVKHYGAELKDSMAEWEFRAINNILKGVKEGDKGDSKWLLTRRTEQWHDKQQHEFMTPDMTGENSKRAEQLQQEIVDSHEQTE